MLDARALGPSTSSSSAQQNLRRGEEGRSTMSSTLQGFSEETLTELLRALRSRTSGHPDNPGLVASWPGVPEARMSAACGELSSRGHPIFRIAIPGRVTDGWAIRSGTDEPAGSIS
jgi:hypothetical protein